MHVYVLYVLYIYVIISVHVQENNKNVKDQ